MSPGRCGELVYDSFCALWQAAVPVADGRDHGASQFEATLDAVEQLRAILRDEHSLLTQYKMIVWGRVFTPVQVSGRLAGFRTLHKLALCSVTQRTQF